MISAVGFAVLMILAARQNDSVLNPAVIAAVIAALAALGGAWLTYRASSRANKTNDRKVDLDEFKEAQAWYKERLAEADRHLERIRAQLDRVNDQLAREQDVSNALRNELRSLQGQVDLLERTLSRNQRSGPLLPPLPPGVPEHP